MVPLQDYRTSPGPIFQLAAIYLLRHIDYQGTINKRQRGKGCEVIFLCTSSLAVHVEFASTYSSDSFLMALRRLVSLQEIHSLKFSQIEAGGYLQASVSMGFHEGTKWAGKRALNGTLCPQQGNISMGKLSG
jgi:hypothetical protein